MTEKFIIIIIIIIIRKYVPNINPACNLSGAVCTMHPKQPTSYTTQSSHKPTCN